jgi:pyruvate/2-oxoglutarate dehydrogenase complex dihydrolipoamide acyltransferase (E2) component
MVTKVVMPPLGETMDEGKIFRWLKKEGDMVAKGDVLLEVETDKTVIEVEAFGKGILRKILVGEEETVAIGTLIAVIADQDDDISDI